MRRGYCFVPTFMLVTLLLRKYEEKLKLALQRAYESVDLICTDKRISKKIATNFLEKK